MRNPHYKLELQRKLISHQSKFRKDIDIYPLSSFFSISLTSFSLIPPSRNALLPCPSPSARPPFPSLSLFIFFIFQPLSLLPLYPRPFFITHLLFIFLLSPLPLPPLSFFFHLGLKESFPLCPEWNQIECPLYIFLYGIVNTDKKLTMSPKVNDQFSLPVSLTAFHSSLYWILVHPGFFFCFFWHLEMSVPSFE